MWKAKQGQQQQVSPVPTVGVFAVRWVWFYEAWYVKDRFHGNFCKQFFSFLSNFLGYVLGCLVFPEEQSEELGRTVWVTESSQNLVKLSGIGGRLLSCTATIPQCISCGNYPLVCSCGGFWFSWSTLQMPREVSSMQLSSSWLGRARNTLIVGGPCNVSGATKPCVGLKCESGTSVSSVVKKGFVMQSEQEGRGARELLRMLSS